MLAEQLDEPWGLKDIAEHLNIAMSTLYNHKDDYHGHEDFPKPIFGNKWYKSEVLEFLQRNRFKAGRPRKAS